MIIRLMKKNLKIYFISIFFFLLCLNQPSSAQNGIVKSYYSNGTVQSEASFVNDVLDGANITYYSNGRVKEEKNFSQGILDGYVREYYSTGVMKEECFVKYGIKDGAYRTYFENGQLKELINYSNGILTNRQAFNSEYKDLATLELPPIEKKSETVSLQQTTIENKLEINLPQSKSLEKKEGIIPLEDEYEILCDVQVCPVPIGGMKGIQDSLVYPEHALRYGLEGTVKIIATINAQGEVIKTQVLKKLGLGCDEAAQEVVRKTRFVPGKNDGEWAETNATITIEFKIFDKSTAK